MSGGAGMVFLVGAGPGDPGLITVRGRDLLRQADVVVYDRLVGDALMSGVRTEAELVESGKVPGCHKDAQERISAFLVALAREGRTVVRLKGGDPFVFGRGWEEWSACRSAGVTCAVVPGVTSAIAAPAGAGIPITCRGIGSSFVVVTAHTPSGEDAASLDYAALAKIDTIVVMMGRSNLGEVTRRLVAAGRDPATPAACVERGATQRQRSVSATLGDVAAAADRGGLEAPVVTVIGEVARCAEAYPAQPGASTMPLAGPAPPLWGRRVLITRSRDSLDDLRARLAVLGAITVECPLIRIDPASPSPDLDDAILALHRYDWIALTSVHGVRAFFDRLSALGRDARALQPCRVGVVGPITAAALLKRGIAADVVPEPHSAAALAEALLGSPAGRPKRVLCPRGDLARPELPRALRDAGVAVDEAVAYHTVALTPPASAVRAIRDGVDAILFCSPSAVRRFAELGVDTGGAVVACIGPTTATAAKAAGMKVDRVAEEADNASLVIALSRCFSAAGVPR